MISVIVPTKNEEGYIGRLLWSIRRQTYTDYEVVVVDGFSTDNTVRIAKLFGARAIVAEGRVSKARNIGSESAKGDGLLYLDADTVLPYDTWLEELMNSIESSGAELAHTYFKPIDSGTIWKLVSRMSSINSMVNNYPLGFCFYSTRALWEKVKFDEELNAGETVDFAYRANKLTAIYLFPMYILTSMRRHKKEGILNVGARSLCWIKNADDVKKCDQGYNVGMFR